MSDSEHSDAEVSFTENGTFNLSRGQTPLTEGSEGGDGGIGGRSSLVIFSCVLDFSVFCSVCWSDLDRHSDAEESFAQDLADFPSINPDATLMDDDDDTSIGLPSLGPSGLAGHRASVLDVESHLDSDQDDLESELSFGGRPAVSDFSGELAGAIASNMIQAALRGAMQPRPPAAQRRELPPRAAAQRSHRKFSGSELDTDLDGEDFEMLDQAELNQMDPFGGGGAGRQGEGQGSHFLSSLLGKPQ